MFSVRGIRRTKSEGKSTAAQYFLAQHGLGQYEDDVDGVFRVWKGSEYEWLSQGQHGHPPFPLMGDNMMWMFRKLSDVSTDAFERTEVGSGTQLTLQNERGGIAKATLGAADNNYQEYFSVSEVAQITSAGVIVVSGPVRIKDISECDFFWGLCKKLTTGNIFQDRVESCGFYINDAGSAYFSSECTKAGATSAEAGVYTPTDEEWVTLGMNITSDPDAGRIDINYFVDGVQVANHYDADFIPTGTMSFAFGLRNGEAVANELSVKFSYLLQN